MFASGVLAALTLAGASHGAAGPPLRDIIIEVPPESKGLLRSGEFQDEALTTDSLLSDGRRYDCWVFGVEPGDDVTISVNTNAFRPAVAILPEPVCDGRSALYFDQASASTSLVHASVTFNAPRNAFGVLVSSRRPGAVGPYRITFTQDVAADAPAWRTYTPSEPERLVQSLYDEDDADFGDPAFIDRTLAPAIAEALKTLNAQTGGLGLGFDFLVDGQDSDITGPEISTRVWLARSSLIDVRFLNMSEPVHLVFHMRETPVGWRVEDIESRSPDNDTNWVLSQELGLDLGVAAARED